MVVMGVVPAKYSTVWTASESLTLELMPILAGALKTAPLAGYNKVIDSGTLVTLILTGAEVAVSPSRVVTTAVKLYLPTGTLGHNKKDSGSKKPRLVTVPMLLVPAKYCTVCGSSEPPISDVRAMLAGAPKFWPLVGVIIVMLGGTGVGEGAGTSCAKLTAQAVKALNHATELPSKRTNETGFIRFFL